MTHQLQPGQHTGSQLSDVDVEGLAGNLHDILLEEHALKAQSTFTKARTLVLLSAV